MWTWLHNSDNSEFKGFFKDEYSLLVSFDLLTLRGLDETRSILNQKGKIITGDFFESKQTNQSKDCFFIPFKDSKPDVDAIDWGCESKDYICCLATLCGYATSSSSKLQLHKKDFRLLRNFFLRELSPNRRSLLLSAKPSVESVLLFPLGWEIKLAQFVPTDPKIF